MTPEDPLNSRFDSASSELRTQLGAAPVPDFEPRPRIAAPVAAIVALLIAGGILAFTQFRDQTSQVDFLDDREQTETPDQDTAEPFPDGSSENDPGELPNESTRRNSDGLLTASADVELTFGQDATQPATDRVRPEIGEQRNDPAFGSVVTRLTDAGGRFNRVDENKRQRESPDGDRLLTHIDDGTVEYVGVLDLATLDEVAQLREIDEETEPTWHPTDNDLIRHLSGGDAGNGALQLFETRVTSGESFVLADLTDRVQAIFPTATHMISNHGRPSADGELWAWIVRDDSEEPVGVISYNLATDQITGSLTDLDPTDDGKSFTPEVTETFADGIGRLLSASVTPSGAYVVLEYGQGTIVHELDFADYRVIENTGDTADVATLANGADAYVFTDFNRLSSSYGHITSVDLETFERTRLINLFDDANTTVEVSGAATATPGWVVVSTYDCKTEQGPEPWTCNKVMAVELGGANRIVSLAHTYNCAESFLAVPHAVPNADLTRIYFTSDNGGCNEAGEIFEITVPEAFGEIVDD